MSLIITFNVNGTLLKAPQVNSKEAAAMAEMGWSFIQVMKSGAGVWIRKSSNENGSKSYIDAKAYVGHDRTVTESTSSNQVMNLLRHMQPTALTKLGIPGNGKYRYRFNPAAPKYQNATDQRAYRTDIIDFAADYKIACGAASQLKKTPYRKLPVIKLF